MHDERRKFSRISIPGEDCHVDFGDQKHIATVMDESINGFSIGGLRVIQLAKGLPVRLNFRDNFVFGTCKNVSRHDQGFRIGIERSFSSTTELNQLDRDYQDAEYIIVPFIEFRGNFVKCIPLEMKTDRVVSIMLWNGRSVDIPAENIFPLTRTERKQFLQHDQVLDLTQRLYSTAEEMPTFDSVESVLNFEFGSDEDNDLLDCLSQCQTLLTSQ